MEQILFDGEDLEQVLNLLKVLVALQSFQVGKMLFDMIYRMILKHAN